MDGWPREKQTGTRTRAARLTWSIDWRSNGAPGSECLDNLTETMLRGNTDSPPGCGACWGEHDRIDTVSGVLIWRMKGAVESECTGKLNGKKQWEGWDRDAQTSQ